MVYELKAKEEYVQPIFYGVESEKFALICVLNHEEN